MKRIITGLMLVLVMAITIFGVAPITISAATINVPGDYLTIKEAIDAASAGDTINVAAGTYYENITLKDGVIVQGAGADVTIINGGGSGSVVTAIGVGSTTVLSGFTITNGSATSGAGMHNNNSSPTVTNCTFSNNHAVAPYSASYGGGMYNLDSSPTVTNCFFYNNSASIDGGGMYNAYSSPVVTSCTFESNSASWGGGMYNAYSSPMVNNCTFYNNEAAHDGGGMYNRGDSSPVVNNCTLSDNSVAEYGGGICNENSSPVVVNCILWNNGEEIHNHGTSVPVVSYCDVQGGYSGTGNIDADPLFADPGADDYHLQTGSPCIDAGDNTAVPGWLTTDFEGDPRIWPEGGVVDMGADECCALPQIEEFGIDYMFIDFDQWLGEDNIVAVAAFSLQEGANYDLSIDEVTVDIDGFSTIIPAGSFRKMWRGEVYSYTSPWPVWPKVSMVLNFDLGSWNLCVRGADASVVDNSDGVDVTFTIGAMSGSEHIDMRIKRLSYWADS